MQLIDLKKEFHKGHYAEVIRAAEGVNRDDSWSPWLAPVVGSLAFLGRLAEAESLVAHGQGRVDIAEAIEARFYLVVALSRASRKLEAEHYQSLNVAALELDPSAISIFFTKQGQAIQHYFRGEFKRAEEFAGEALSAAVGALSIWGRMLATDLLGHLQVYLGRIHAGLRSLALADEWSKAVDNAATTRAVEISVLLYRSQFGIRADSCVRDLQRAAQRLGTEEKDNYSAASLYLELGHQFTRRAEFAKAERVLTQANELIFTHQLARQESLLYFRWAQLSYLRGKDLEALAQVNSGMRGISGDSDPALAIHGWGLERKIFAAIGQTENPFMRSRHQALFVKTADFDGARHRQILGREAGQFIALHSEDTVGALVDQVAEARNSKLTKSLAREVIDQHLRWLLFEHPMGLKRGKKEIRFDLVPNTLILSSPELGVETLSLGRKRTPIRILEALAQGPLSKADLFVLIWKRKFVPHLHASTLYAAIQSARKLLGSFQDWLVTTDSGYRLHSGVEVSEPQRSRGLTTRSQSSRPRLETLSDWDSRMNYRQHTALKQLERDESIGVGDYVDLFKVSAMTAFRDLDQLVKLGFLSRRGKARLTRYFKIE